MEEKPITVLEEMILSLKNRIVKRMTENTEKRNSLIPGSEGFMQQSITYSSRHKTAQQTLTDIEFFEQRVKKMLSYEGNNPNYLLLPTNEAAGLYFSRHPNGKKGVEGLDNDNEVWG